MKCSQIGNTIHNARLYLCLISDWVLVSVSKCGLYQVYKQETDQCVCEEGRKGEDCSVLEDSCGLVPKCLNNGVCENDGCKCSNGFRGVDCGVAGTDSLIFRVFYLHEELRQRFSYFIRKMYSVCKSWL